MVDAGDGIENLLADLNESYNAKNKAWGFFQGESGAYPFSGWLGEYLEGDRDFVGFSREAVEHLQKLMEESNLSTGGYVLFAHYQQGMTDYLAIALLHHSEGAAVNESLDVTPSSHLDLGQLHLAARINLSEWILVCGECHQLNRADGDEHPRCSRCGAVLHARRPNSLTRTWALLITAAILYIPANLLPIMTVNLFGSGMPATIMEGVVELVHADMFPIAMVVFVASILVPTFKLVGIALLLYSVQRHQPMSARRQGHQRQHPDRRPVRGLVFLRAWQITHSRRPDWCCPR